ncbi:hypothetical protein H2O64_10675 [Kordia sp. YSTF-M3]|uniref:Glycosyltransferase RgtA/B/C/D-like domain-containing protein n=1 Tax=Kordia aestuariivivens TaxID=2759037 RepID=A0ABR7Q9P6_9FLAO|nr:hypothetical protein [Kordia aestuariivivens]MBC8755138.1 hypothetical protein [Kordia aestuariivivens]
MKYKFPSKKKNIYYLISVYYIFIFAILFFTSLNYNYVEGDDASIILHHLFGRDAALQKPFSSYHSLFDTYLGFFGLASEVAYRKFALLSTFIMTLASLSVLSYCVLVKTKQTNLKGTFFLLMLVPFMIPELLFEGLYINPTMHSFFFLLLSYCSLLHYFKKGKNYFLILTAIAFGIATGFRWVNGFFIFFLLAELFLHYSQVNKIENKNVFTDKRFYATSIIFGVSCILTILTFIAISGYSIIDIKDTFLFARSYMAEPISTSTKIKAAFINNFTFLTPACVILFILGIVATIKKESKLLLPLLLTYLPFAILITAVGTFKTMIFVFPAFLLIVLTGWNYCSKRVRLLILIVIFIPWLIGVKVNYNNVVWGPDFTFSIKNNSDKKTANSDIGITLHGGLAIPTPEGPRPLGGFFSVLLGGEWYAIVEKINQEREDAFQFAIKNNVRILQGSDHCMMYTKLFEKGYTSNDPLFYTKNGLYCERTFTNATGDQLEVNFFILRDNLYDKASMIQFGNEKMVFYSVIPNFLSKLENKYQEQFQRKGAFWGILEIEE